jgi:hypothetical protein
MSKERLEALLNEAACIYDAPDMAQVAEHLIKNNVVALPCAVGDDIYVIGDGKVEKQRVLGVKVGLCGTLIQVPRARHTDGNSRGNCKIKELVG